MNVPCGVCGQEARGVGDAAPYGRVRTGSAGRRGRRPLRACADGKRGASGTPPHTGVCGREARGVGDAAPYGVCGREARGVGDAAPYGVCGRAHMAANDRPYGASFRAQREIRVPRPLILDL